jgi:hypothetical protein
MTNKAPNKYRASCLVMYCISYPIQQTSTFVSVCLPQHALTSSHAQIMQLRTQRHSWGVWMMEQRRRCGRVVVLAVQKDGRTRQCWGGDEREIERERESYGLQGE